MKFLQSNQSFVLQLSSAIKSCMPAGLERTYWLFTPVQQHR
jgi:hypothetical protein